MNQPLRTAGIAFGAGIASLSLHEGLAQAGVPCTLTLANEIGEEYLDLASANHPSVGAGTIIAAAPMQEAVVDDWLMQRVGTVEVLEAGIPCSGASKAGRAKRGLARMEDHPWVGHLIGACIVAITRLQPAVVLGERVDPARLVARRRLCDPRGRAGRQRLREPGGPGTVVHGGSAGGP